MTTLTTPPAAVVAAFGGSGEPAPLRGGQGATWVAGEVVLKPSASEVESRWRAEVLETLQPSDMFDVARPLRAANGDWIFGGWEGWQAMDGHPDTGRPDDAIRAGMAFHEAISQVEPPAFIDARDDPWSHGDRVAWEEEPLPEEPLLRYLADIRRPMGVPNQLVHGDLLGNVLFAKGRRPVIIDWPAYWRPPSWAAAVAVVDALCWYEASPGLLDRWAHLPDWDQALVRALIYRVVTDYAAAGRPADWTPREAYRDVAELVTARMGDVGQ